jgi:hypothetical protein
MSKKTVRETFTRRLVTAAASFSLAICAAAHLGCAPAAGQTIKSALVSATLAPTSSTQWSQDLSYRQTQLYALTLNSLGCPFVDVEFAGTKVPLMLDTGTARGFVLTNEVPPVPHRIEGRHEELNADGSHRGESLSIRVESVEIIGEVFRDVTGSLSDWRMFSSEPFNGTVGLDFFLNRRLTLDYRSGRVGTTPMPLPEKLDHKRYVSVDLVDPPKSQGHILYARARVNRHEAIVYFDTGYNVSFIDPGFAEGLSRIDRPGKFGIFRNGVPMELGGQTFIFDDLRESPIRRGAGFDTPVAMVLGSDLLSRFVVTIDIRARKLILAVAE